MRITTITVSYGRTIPTKPYGGDRVDVTYTADIDEDEEEASLCAIELRHAARAQVEAAEALLKAEA